MKRLGDDQVQVHTSTATSLQEYFTSLLNEINDLKPKPKDLTNSWVFRHVDQMQVTCV